ncbi:MAG: hybrid sensor histidine kinase/response regulator transcription factor [Crocinitomicaceae bacterium]
MAQQFNFRNFNVEDGLGQSQVYAMCQAPSGALWLGTRGGGISIYDGIEFKSLTTNNGLANNYINCLKLGPDSTIWIGTNNGISFYKNGQLESLKMPGNPVVRDIVFLENGEIRAASNKGLLTVTKQSLSFGKIKTIDQPDASSIIEFNGKTWFGTNDGLFRVEKDGNYFCGDDSRYMRNAITCLSKDSKGNLWIGTYGDGMYCFDGKNYFRVDLQLELYRKTVLNVYVDENDNLWIATLRSGVIQYDQSSKTFTTLSESEGLSNNHVRCILQDNSKQYWFGTSGGGVCQFLGKQFATYDMRSGLAGNFIYSVLRDSKKRLWVGNSQVGVSVYENGTFTNYSAENGFVNVKVKSIAEDREGTIWFGTDGSGVYNYKNEEFTAIEGLRGVYVKEIKKGPKGNIWIATMGNGLVKVAPKNNNYIITKWVYSDGLPSSRLTSLEFDSQGRLWFGTENDGLGCFYPEEGRMRATFHAGKNGLSSNQIRCLAEDKFGRLWVGTAGGGLNRFDTKAYQPKVSYIRQQDGLKSDNIYLLIADGKGNIISGTEKGLDYLIFGENGSIQQIKYYGKQDGFSGVETCQNSCWLDNNGTIWLGTINGLCQFNPNELAGNPEAPLLAFKDIKLFYESILENNPDALNQGTRSNPLELSYTQNHITFEFLGINLRRPDMVRYQWKLNGFDSDWSPLSKDRSIVYSNLNPGTYTFQIRASNEDGVWSEPISYSFTIATPYYETVWFRALIGTGIVVLLLLIYFISIKRIRKNARIKQREVEFEKDLLELEQKAMRLQMNPHFIFNALNSIQSLIGTGKETEARYFLAKFSRLMRQILDNSRKSSITLEEEVQTLENYLLIEQFCNGQRFQYQIDVSAELEQDFISLPPMILQPFVENAIKHGMRGLAEDAEGKINIRFIEKDGVLECIVEDNGIGREKSAELNRISKETYHKSTALAVTTDRLEYLKAEGISTPLEIVDLYEDGVATGTRIIIRLPLN